MCDKYILQGKEVIQCVDLVGWASWLETADRHVAKDTVNDSDISTVFLGLDHQFGTGPQWIDIVHGKTLKKAT